MLTNRKNIAITMGDPAGIGPEIIVKSLNVKDVYEKCIPIVIGDYEALKDAVDFCGLNIKLNEIHNPSEAKGEFGVIDYINLDMLKPDGWEYKKPQALCGDACFKYIIYAIELAIKHEVEAVITAPINKEALKMGGHNYSGHTEIFAEYTNTQKYGMMLASGRLRVIHVSTHCSLREACDRVKKERVLEVIRLAQKGCELLGIKNPSIGVAGLNPHSSENGLFGNEEENEIIPAISEAREEGINVTGPVPPDTVFVKCMGGQFDIVVAM
ncbi:MAG: 4-hydroxythreonine-4-phosphate dehydrogenase PdxA, partial [Firmicutes bacterium]|nr:4-hydroxythreonine-4-phosphate dehydrogenase PdxA [Bacillota bacterium]